jgi:C1A family cysteine protease
MRSGYVSLAVVGVAAAVAVYALSAQPRASSLFQKGGLTQDDVEFVKFLAKEGKNYITPEEFAARRDIFVANKKFIAEENAKNNNLFRLGTNKFSDLTEEEFKAYLGLKVEELPSNADIVTLEETTSDSVDWRNNGAVNPMKDQGSCGSCWAFSAVSSLESANFLKNGELLDLSEQQFVDCSRSTGSQGCNGGWMHWAFDYAKTVQVELTATYPYKAKDNACSHKADKGVVQLTSYAYVPARSSAQLKAAIAKQPVSVALAAGNRYFQGYESGILNSKQCPTRLDHAVTAVGFGTEGGQDYYIIRNSWGAAWGEDGYIKLAADDSANGGLGICGVQSQYSVYPQVE